jgi:hypothetical protein
MLLISWTVVSDILYSLKTPGYLFSNALGVLVFLSCFLLYRKIKKPSIQLVISSLFIVLTYPLFGFYTLFTALLCVISKWGNGTRKPFIFLLINGLLVIIVPYLYYTYLYTQMQFTSIYLSGLPKFYFIRDELYLWTPFIILFLSLLLFSFFLYRKKEKSKKETQWKAIVSESIFAALLIGSYFYSNRNENLRTELKMNRLIENNQWEEVVDAGKELKSNPTRLIVMDYNLALYKMGKAGDKMFSMNNHSTLPQSKRLDLLMMHLGGKAVYFQYGKINYCYRWCMEDMVEYGMNVSILKYMVKCTVINGEWALARKYNAILKQTLFHKQWAEKYQQYIDNHVLIKEDPEIKAIIPLMAYENVLDGDAGMLELYILNSFAFMEGGTPEIVELSLQCNLVLKNIERFWPRFFLYARTHDRIPLHYQEAAILYAYLEGKVDISRLKLDKTVIDNFGQLLAMSKLHENKSDEFNKKTFKPQFGDTFWYYYFFIKDMKTN